MTVCAVQQNGARATLALTNRLRNGFDGSSLAKRPASLFLSLGATVGQALRRLDSPVPGLDIWGSEI